MQTTASRLYPFVPSGPDFQKAIDFFHLIGFETLWRQAGLAGLRFGGAYFLLQEIDVPEWARNQMITFEVDDLEAYWAEIAALDLPGRFAGVALKPPTDYPWAREINLIDPAGVCWHVRQSRPPA